LVKEVAAAGTLKAEKASSQSLHSLITPVNKVCISIIYFKNFLA
jgi:hypothetical protein